MLETKLHRITLAFQGSMEDPEDMCQAIIGMTQPSMYTHLFASAPLKPSGIAGMVRQPDGDSWRR